MSEVKLFLGKKITHFWRKKITQVEHDFLKKNKGSQNFLSKWQINYSWEKIKKIFFFFQFFGKKKTLFQNLDVWVTPKLIPGKKNGTFGGAEKKIQPIFGDFSCFFFPEKFTYHSFIRSQSCFFSAAEKNNDFIRSIDFPRKAHKNELSRGKKTVLLGVPMV